MALPGEGAQRGRSDVSRQRGQDLILGRTLMGPLEGPLEGRFGRRPLLHLTAHEASGPQGPCPSSLGEPPSGSLRTRWGVV